jgi:hypothetical protein
MTKNITIIDNSGLFNSIRHFDDEGNEYWFARELMPSLGYKLWQRFEGAIDRATATLENIGCVKVAHINHLSGKITKDGREGDDYKLSRLACYLVAINGDPRKPKIAAAQAYFVTKAREAEIAASNQPQTEQSDRPNLDTFTIYDLKPWQIERLVAAIECRKENESIPAAYFEGMKNFDDSIWEIPFEVINWLQSLHQDMIEEFTYRKCLESNNLSNNKVLQDYVCRFEADAAIRDYSQVREMAKVIEPFAKIQLVEKELAASKGAESKPLGFGKPKK